MYAIIKTGGKQYRVAEGETLRVEKLNAEGDSNTVKFDQVLLVGGDEVKIGTPMVEGASVDAEILRQGRAKKISSSKRSAVKVTTKSKDTDRPLLRSRLPVSMPN